MPALEFESWIGRILKLEPGLTRVCVIYPRMAFTFERGRIESLGVKPSEMIKVILSNGSSSEQEKERIPASSSIDPSTTIRAKVRFLSRTGFVETLGGLAAAVPEIPSMETFPADNNVHIHCWFDTSPKDSSDGIVRLMYKDALLLNPRKDDIITITIYLKN